ncbi:hypothetical protein GF374_03150 [Candidatus Woesearchaeota archaeon]|jgi:KaiC/GvpD/RAD55 family RecA-like ATPase|nr:hypothetical protein [Candidatus Woesearchaeota archaeon]
MGIPVNIVGLNKFIKEIPDGNIILLEGKIDPVKTFFVEHIGCTAVKNGRDVVYIASRVIDEIKEELFEYNSDTKSFNIIEERSSRHWKDYIKNNSLLIVDSFSYLMLDKSLYEFRDNLEDLRQVIKEKNSIVLLTVEEGMLDEKAEVTAKYLADGIIIFKKKETSKGISRYVIIPKWKNNMAFNDNIYYDFDGCNMKVDMRSRVV